MSNAEWLPIWIKINAYVSPCSKNFLDSKATFLSIIDANTMSEPPDNGPALHTELHINIPCSNSLKKAHVTTHHPYRTVADHRRQFIIRCNEDSGVMKTLLLAVKNSTISLHLRICYLRWAAKSLPQQPILARPQHLDLKSLWCCHLGARDHLKGEQ